VAAINTFVPVVARRLGASPFMLSLIYGDAGGGTSSPSWLPTAARPPQKCRLWSCLDLGARLFLLTFFVVAPLPFTLIVVAHWLIVSLPLPGYVELMRQIYPTLTGAGRCLCSCGLHGLHHTGDAAVWVAAGCVELSLLVPAGLCLWDPGGLTFGQVKHKDVLTQTRHGFLSRGGFYGLMRAIAIIVWRFSFMVLVV